MRDRKRRSVLRRARADGDGMRRSPGHLITGAGREEVLRKGGGEEARSVRPMVTGLPSVLMLLRRAAAFAKMRPTFPFMPE